MGGNLKSYLAEFIGTFALVFVGAGSFCVDAASGGRLGLGGLALAYGAAGMMATYAYGPISGGHFNPAITLAFYATGRTDAIKTVFYVVSQLLGAALAGQLLLATMHQPELQAAPAFLGACDLTGIGFRAATLLEAVGTFFLVSAVYATTVDARGRAGAAPLAAGVALAAGMLCLGPLTGAALNPARAFGPAVVTGHWTHWYVYWAGPLVGGVCAALLYEMMFLEAKK
jgi:MIP family channel proteins